MAYKLKVLSPVHIQSGEVIKSINYMEKDDKVLIFNEMDVIESVKQDELLNDELLRSFATTDNRRREYSKTLDYYIRKGIIDDSVVDKCRTQADNHVDGLSGQEIYRNMNNIQGPYIPGSSIKGVVRTAILYDYLLKKGIDYIKEAVNYLNSKDGRFLKIDDYILYEKQNNGRIDRDIYKDPFKFLGIKDINMVENKLGIYQETIFNIDNFVPGNVIETIDAGDYSEEFDFEIRLHEKLAGRYKKEITDYFKEEELLRVLHQFTQDIIQDEIEYYKSINFKLLNTKEIIDALKLIESKNTPEAPVIRLGKGKGYKSNTVALAIKKLDESYYTKEIRNIAKPYKYSKHYEFPKTRKFVNSTLSPRLLGFVCLEKVDI